MKAVEGTGRRFLAVRADVRDLAALQVTGVALPVDGGMTAPFKIPHG